MNGKERLAATLEHKHPDRVCVDFGATAVTGIHVSALTRLRNAMLVDSGRRVKVIEPYQMLGEVDDELREALGVDVIGVLTRKSILGTQQKDWKPFTMYDGTQVLAPGDFNTTVAENGDTLIYPEGDTSVPPSGIMPKGGYFFDAIVRQEPIDDSRLNVEDNLEEFGPLNEDDLAYYREQRRWLEERKDAGVILVVPGAAFGDIALVPAPFLKHPKGIRDVQEWYLSTSMRRDYVLGIFERQCEIAEKNVQTLIALFGNTVQAAMITGTDFGMQTGPFIGNDTYRALYKPFHVRINNLIHRKSRWKTFIHSCGSVYKLIPDFIDAGFDILNPVQCSAAEMDAARLKKEFGRDIVFWGAGVNTQWTMAFGKPQEVYDEVRQRIDIFGKDGGFVFNAIHNIQANTPVENMLALFRAIRES